jgi:hypothetical protein
VTSRGMQYIQLSNSVFPQETFNLTTPATNQVPQRQATSRDLTINGQNTNGQNINGQKSNSVQNNNNTGQNEDGQNAGGQNAGGQNEDGQSQKVSGQNRAGENLSGQSNSDQTQNLANRNTRGLFGRGYAYAYASTRTLRPELVKSHTAKVTPYGVDMYAYTHGDALSREHDADSGSRNDADAVLDTVSSAGLRDQQTKKSRSESESASAKGALLDARSASSARADQQQNSSVSASPLLKKSQSDSESANGALLGDAKNSHQGSDFDHDTGDGRFESAASGGGDGEFSRDMDEHVHSGGAHGYSEGYKAERKYGAVVCVDA